MLEEFRDRFGAAMEGVLLQPMAERGRELIIGVDSDETFGPVVVFGLGGTDTDLIADRVARLTPVSDVDALGMVHGLRAAPVLFGSDTALPIDKVVDILTRVSHLAQVLPEVAELDINPVIVRHEGTARRVDHVARPLDGVVPQHGGMGSARRQEGGRKALTERWEASFAQVGTVGQDVLPVPRPAGRHVQGLFRTVRLDTPYTDYDNAWGLGFGVYGDGEYGMGGLGGSYGGATPTYTMAFMTGSMGDHDRADRVENAVRACLGMPPLTD